MSEQITKNDLADFTEQIINEIDERLHAMEVRMDKKICQRRNRSAIGSHIGSIFEAIEIALQA